MRSWWLIAGLVGCYHPSPPEGRPCSDEGGCPLPQQCVLGVCTSHDPGEVDAAIDADPSCLCSDSATLTCTSGPRSCELGCSTAPAPHCAQIVPSNGLDVAKTAKVTTDIHIDTAVFDTDTGEITGSLTRAAGTGVLADIGFETRMSGGVALGVFTFHALHLSVTGKIQFTGAQSAVFLVGDVAVIAGTIDGSGGCAGMDASCAGPGGGLGARDLVTVAGGCGPGTTATGVSGSNVDSGGGGGGAGGDGAPGGLVAPSTPGAGGPGCLAMSLEPLVGGSGGGDGSKSDGLVPGKGGGGGGAFQLTALSQITVSGTITMGGAGGAGGVGGVSGVGAADGNAGGGAGGGAGGAILLEAPIVTIAGTVAANGGGGGGAGVGLQTGNPGHSGAAGTTPALGGGPASGNGGGSGGNGASGAIDPQPGITGTSNGGGGGGGIGVIFIRAFGAPPITGVTSPVPGTATLPTR